MTIPTGGRVLFCGDRNWQHVGIIRRAILTTHPEVVIEGEAQGADQIARRIADAFKIPVEPYPANWYLHGKSAGFMRNRQMLNEGRPDRVFAFHDHLAKSKGTRNMVGAALAARVPVWLVRSDGSFQQLTEMPGSAPLLENARP